MNSPVSRRRFLRQAMAASGALSLPGALTAASKPPVSESLVTTLFGSLTEEQRKDLCFPFDHPLRRKVDNNWHVTEPIIRDFLTADQQQMVREIFLNLHSESYRNEVMKQVVHDNGAGGFGDSSIALFGEPGTGKFEFVLTSRHVTRRCDGDSVAGKAFGGPIFYGHAAQGFNEKPDHPGNVYWFQAKRANEVFAMLDGKQREKALVLQPRPERGNATVQLRRDGVGLEGIPVADLASDQKAHVLKVLEDLLMPFRPEDVAESMALIQKVGLEKHSLAFYKGHDIGEDGVWDTWQLEGPGLVWHFRGKPHVHTWVHIADPDVPDEAA
ncbi:MAG: Protein of unknown function DUF3500 [Verrucomicrobia bacterium]|nr:MAG: Protein of unknown function DUF3500 [Verrucomicrobiota bacterium]